MFRYRRIILVRVDLSLLVTPEVLPHIVMETAYCLLMVTILRAMRPRVKAAVLHDADEDRADAAIDERSCEV
jgi:hypothetical protein